jgi:hypothetical protein
MPRSSHKQGQGPQGEQQAPFGPDHSQEGGGFRHCARPRALRAKATPCRGQCWAKWPRPVRGAGGAATRGVPPAAALPSRRRIVLTAWPPGRSMEGRDAAAAPRRGRRGGRLPRTEPLRSGFRGATRRWRRERPSSSGPPPAAPPSGLAFRSSLPVSRRQRRSPRQRTPSRPRSGIPGRIRTRPYNLADPDRGPR